MHDQASSRLRLRVGRSTVFIRQEGPASYLLYCLQSSCAAMVGTDVIIEIIGFLDAPQPAEAPTSLKRMLDDLGVIW